MPLNAREVAITSHELAANLTRTEIPLTGAAADLVWSVDRLEHALAVDGHSDPVDVWELRDYLDQTLRSQGVDAVPFSVLTEDARVRARMWFRLRPAPTHVIPS